MATERNLIFSIYAFTQVLVLRELAESTPTFFFQQVQSFFDNIFNAVRDPKVSKPKQRILHTILCLYTSFCCGIIVIFIELKWSEITRVSKPK